MAERMTNPSPEAQTPAASRAPLSMFRLPSSFVLRHSSFVILLLLAGCAGYHLGPTAGQTAGARSIQINPFLNQTIEPRLSEALTHALRKQIQQDGTFRLNTADDGDIILTGAIIKYDRMA